MTDNEKRVINGLHKHYRISYRNRPLLVGAANEEWELDLEEAKQRRDELNRVIAWCEARDES